MIATTKCQSEKYKNQNIAHYCSAENAKFCGYLFHIVEFNAFLFVSLSGDTRIHMHNNAEEPDVLLILHLRSMHCVTSMHWP